jgi:hypothetical protein
MSKPDACLLSNDWSTTISGGAPSSTQIAAPQPRELQEYRYVTVALLSEAAEPFVDRYVPEWLKGRGERRERSRLLRRQLLPKQIRIGLIQRYRLEIESAYASMRPTDDLKDRAIGRARFVNSIRSSSRPVPRA